MIYGGGDRNQISKSFLMIFLYFSYTSPLFGQPQDVYDSGWLVLVVKQKKLYFKNDIYTFSFTSSTTPATHTHTPHFIPRCIPVLWDPHMWQAKVVEKNHIPFSWRNYAFSYNCVESDIYIYLEKPWFVVADDNDDNY